jgi:AcrR family transcriptional regulator
MRPGRDGLGWEQVTEIQRARMLSAMFEEVAERGAANVTVAHVVARSGVPRRTFYDLFVDREDCFLAAFDEAIQRIASAVVPACEQPAIWREKIRAGLTALLEFLDYEPGMGRLVVVETLGAGPRALERRQRVLAQIVTTVEEGRLEANKGDGPPPLTAEGIVGAVFSLIHSRLSDGRDGRLVELLNPLMSMIVLPYLGLAAARKELQRPVPKPSDESRRTAPDPLRELEMRLTYRTIRALMAIASRSGSSNRTIAELSGITDQGQISKLLTRLQRLGLIENTGAGLTRGEPNAWALTDKGREVEYAIAGQAKRS